MMEKQQHQTSQVFRKKIIPYLDGALTPEEKSEFEAYALTHPEFHALVKQKEFEVGLLKSMIPTAQLSPTGRESLESEMKLSVFNLLKEEPRNFWDDLKLRFEEWVNR